MKAFKKTIIIILLTIILTSCATKEKYVVNEETNLKGKIVTQEVTRDGETKTITVLELEKEINIDGTNDKKIEINYNKDLKDNTETTLKGTIKENSGDSDLSYSFEVDDVENILSYINTFSNQDFQMTIPAPLMKITTITEIKDGFIVYSTSNMPNGGEVFRIQSVPNSKFKQLNKSTTYYEKVTSDTEKTIIIIYPTGSEYTEEYEDEYIKIADEINSIKDSIRIK